MTQHFTIPLFAAMLTACSAPKVTRPASSAPVENADAGTGKELHTQNGQALADSIMAQWSLQHTDRNWEDEVRRSHPAIPGPADNSALVSAVGDQGHGHTYGSYSEQDIALWKRETEKVVLEGARIFHDAAALGSPVAVSCDMCHPDAANTHPETYPKFQVQMGRVAHLRDMINWCLINPLRAKAMKPDDARMRAIEAYLMAQRKGTALNYGKH